MAKHLRRRTSKLPEEEVIPGCLWGLFHSFDIHQRLRLRKMLGERRSTSNGRHATGTKKQKRKAHGPPAGVERDLMETEANISPQVEDRTGPADKASQVLKQQGTPKQKGQKRKIIPFAERLRRTISMHHAQCNEYAHPNETPNNSETKEAPLLSHNSNPSASNQHTPPPLPEPVDEVHKGKRSDECGTMNIGPAGDGGHKKLDVLGCQLLEKQALLQKILKEAKESLLEQQKGDKELQADVVLRRSSDILEALELLNANNELFMKLLQEPGATTISNSLQDQVDPRSGMVLTKSRSYPGVGFSVRSGNIFKLKDETDPHSLTKQEEYSVQSPASSSNSKRYDKLQLTADTPRPAPCTHGVREIAANSEPSSGFTQVVKRHKDRGTAAYGFKVIKQRIKDIVKENRKEKQRISLDRVLHRVPYGCKAPQDIKGDEKPCLWEGPDSDRCDGDGSTCRNSIRQVQRCRSLNESMERYSYLLESSFSREPKRQTSERIMKLEGDDDSGFQVPRAPTALARIFSSPEFEAYSSSKDDQSEEASDDVLTTGSMVVSAPCMEEGDTPAEPSSIAVTETDLEDEPVNPEEFSVMQELTTDETCFDEEEPADHINPQDQSSDVDDPTNIIEADGSNGNIVQIPTLQLDLDVFHVPVDSTHGVEFHYVRDILKRYLLDGNDPSIERHLKEETESSAHELEPDRLDRELLYDLTNEVLLEIFESAYDDCPWLAGARKRPGPAGDHHLLLEEVWANVSWHLKPQTHADATLLECIIDRDLKKKDGWMNLTFDMEYVGLDLEELLLDDLLDESILEFLDSEDSTLHGILLPS